MSYQALPYTYGALTEAQIDAIPTSSPKITAGSTVFNTDTQMLEIYNGRIWLDERSLCFLIDSGVTVVKGNTLYTVGSGTTATGEVALMTSSTTNYPKFVGVANRNPVGGFVSVAHCGKVQAIAGATITRGNAVEPSATAGRFQQETSPSTGSFGVALESGTSGDLLWIALQTIELG
jgi:hypothetical protein